MTIRTPAQAALIAEAVLRIKRELLHSIIMEQVIPLNVQSFGQLHDYCDANCLGGFCDEGPDSMSERFDRTFPERTNADTVSTQGAIDAINEVQCTIGHWIERGQMVRDAAACARMVNEQLSCLFDDTRAGEAWGMVQDLDARVSLWPYRDDVERVTALMVTTVQDMTTTRDASSAYNTGDNFASEDCCIVVVTVPNDDRRPEYAVRMYEGPQAEQRARADDEEHGLWIDGAEVANH